ncbi:hypothetical protein V2G26_016927 [Clonostachys chloroleuca]
MTSKLPPASSTSIGNLCTGQGSPRPSVGARGYELNSPVHGNTASRHRSDARSNALPFPVFSVLAEVIANRLPRCLFPHCAVPDLIAGTPSLSAPAHRPQLTCWPAYPSGHAERALDQGGKLRHALTRTLFCSSETKRVSWYYLLCYPSVKSPDVETAGPVHGRWI